MNTNEAIELLLKQMNTRRQFVGGVFAGWGGTTGNINIMQKDVNAAISAWQEKHDIHGLQQIASTMQVYGNLTDVEYEQIMKAFDGEN